MTVGTGGDHPPRQAENAETARTRHVSKSPISDATIQRKYFIRECRDEEVGLPIGVHVTKIDPHARNNDTAFVESDANRET